MPDLTVVESHSVFLNGVAQRWWVLALRGVAALLFGVLALAAPGLTLVVLTLWFAAFMAADGMLALLAGFGALAHHRHGGAALLTEGLLGLLVAAILLIWPGLGIAGVVVLAALWALMTGAALLWAVAVLPMVAGRLLMGLAAVLSLLLGALLIAHPAAGAFALAVWLGVYALASGTVMLVLAARLRTAAARGKFHES